jgi:TonB family protein
MSGHNERGGPTERSVPTERSGPTERRRRLLADYAKAAPVLLPANEGAFHRLWLLSVLTALGLGAGLAAVEPLPSPAPAAAATSAPFRWVTLPPARPAAVRSTPLPPPAAPVAARPRREAPVLAAEPAPSARPGDAQAAAAAAAGPARRVYGVRQVYAQGLGAEAGAGALLTKRGNTLSGAPDSLVAREADLLAGGEGGSGLPGASKPVLVHQVEPRYSPAMLAARVSGVVRLRLLVGAGGAVERVEVLEDIGYDSAALATAACRQFRFEPARRGEVAVADWIRLSIRFEFKE